MPKRQKLLRDELKQYCNDVIAGKIIACQKHRWACARFKRDLKRENTKAFPYIFRDDLAERFFRWAGLFKHRKGVLKGKHIKFHIIQKFIFGNVYGWVHRKTGYRRFQKFYWQVARKNAKSQSLALVGSYETIAFDGGTNEVYCAATKTEQARIVYDETCAMLNNCAILKNKYKIHYGRIRHIKTDSVMRPLSEEDRKTGDGLNPQCGIVDEYHAHETSEVYDIIDSGMIAREQPLLAIITTAGFELENPCYRVEYDLVSKILNPDIAFELDHYFVMINELDHDDDGNLVDDISDPKAWIKANPIACSYPEGIENIKKKLQAAQEAPEKMRSFKTKNMNIWIQEREMGYMNMKRWAACKGKLPELKETPCYIGVDLSAKLDLTSIAFEWPMENKYYVHGHSFMPEETLQQKMKTDKVPYDLWVNEGHITLTPGAVVDYKALMNYAIELAEKNDWHIVEWCLDPWGTLQLAADLDEKGYTVVEIIQGIKTLSEPTKDFRNMIYEKRVVHDGNPVIAWAASNAIADAVDRNENIILNKKKSRQRIDPIAAIINAHVRASTAPEPAEPKMIFF